MRINLKQIRHSKQLLQDINLLKLSKCIKISENISSLTQIITLNHIPIKDKPVVVDINGIYYEENEDFIIDYTIGRIYWINKEFKIDFDDEITVHYYISVNDYIKPNKKYIVAGGNFHSYTLIDDKLYSCGLNNESLVDINNSNTEDIYPILSEISGLGKILDLSGSINHTVVLTENGELFSWGSNSVGQLGIGSTTEYVPGIHKINLSNIIKVECGDFFNLALDQEGNVYSWGYNTFGQLGTGDKSNRYLPYKIPQLTNIKDIICDGSYAAAIDMENNLWVWGNNYYGQLGLGHNKNVTTPTKSAFKNVISVFPGYDSLFVLDYEKNLWSAGDNLYGQLGIGSDILNVNIPQKVVNISDVITLSRSNYHIIALVSDNTVYSWGRNDSGQLGHGHTNNLNSPTHIKGLFNITNVATGHDCTYVLRNDGVVSSFGNNDVGQLGVNNIPLATNPININLEEKIVNISSGYKHVFAISEKNVFAWGNNKHGQLGVGTTTDCFEPKKMLLN